MKILKYIFAIIITLSVVFSCETDTDKTYYFDYITAPSNISVTFDITQDNSGLVTILPNAEGAVKYLITFGDNETEEPTEYLVGEKITHIYAEGIYSVSVIAVSISGLAETCTEVLVVSFKAPENLAITVENDIAVSKQVNISATADYATIIEFYFGELTEDTAVVTTPGETVSHIYANPGDYEITVIAKSGAIETLDSTFTFTVTEITGPQIAAPTPPGRVSTDVISIFSDAYTNVANTNFNPNWGQSTIVTTEEVVTGDEILKYSNLNYQGTQFESAIDASGMEFLHIDMWTEDATTVNFYAISSGPAEKDYSLTVTAETWVSYDIPLTYFDNVNLADIIQFKVDGTAGSSVYFDNIYFYKVGAATEPSLPLDFESTTTNYNWTDFDGGAVTIINNPQSSGINTSAKVAQMVKNGGATWGGSWIALDVPMDFSSNKTFSMKVYSPRVGAKVLLKVENLTNGGINHEVELTTTKANEWEELLFDYSAINTSESYQKIVLIFDNGTAGDGTANYTWLFDDIKLVDPVLLPLDFESSTKDYAWTNFDGGVVTIIDNSQSSGINTSAKVAQMVKNAGQTWGGSWIPLYSPIDFSVNKTFKMKVYSPRVGAKVLLKVENMTNGGINHEVEVTTSVANEWEELTFDYSAINTSNSYQKIVLIFDNGTAGDGTANFTWLFDDIQLIN
jgi:hypothetical protein